AKISRCYRPARRSAQRIVEWLQYAIDTARQRFVIRRHTYVEDKIFLVYVVVFADGELNPRRLMRELVDQMIGHAGDDLSHVRVLMEVVGNLRRSRHTNLGWQS